MAGGEDEGSESDAPSRPPRRRRTEPGLAPPSGDDLDPHQRVTLDFSGPPLALPGEDPAGGPGLSLDTTELEEPGAERMGDALSLDLSGIAEEQNDSRGHDGWTRDRLRRGSGVHPSVPPGPPTPPPDGDPRALPVSDEPDAIGLVDRSRSSHHDLDLSGEMSDRYALGDFTGALRAAELLIGRDPDHAEARRYAESSRERLVHLYTSRLGGMDRTPEVAVPDSEVRWLGLDHKAGFLLSRVDGVNTLEEIVDVSGMPRLEALKMLVELLDAGAIRFD